MLILIITYFHGTTKNVLPKDPLVLKGKHMFIIVQIAIPVHVFTFVVL